MRRVLLLMLLLLAPLAASVITTEVRRQGHFPRRFAEVVPESVYRGGFPTGDQIENLREEKNVRTIVSLTSPQDRERDAELTRAAARNGLTLLSFPMPGDGVCEDYNVLDRAADAVADSKNWPVFFHCAAGKQRSNAVTGAFRLKYSGWPIDQVLSELERDYDLDSQKEARLCEHLKGYAKWLAERRRTAAATPKPKVEKSADSPR